MGVKTRNLGNSEGKDIQWQTPLNADGSTIFNLEAGKGYFINTTGGEVELKLPTGSTGDQIEVMDFAGTFNTNPIRLNLNGQKLNGSTNPSGGGDSENYVKIETDNTRIKLVFSDSDKGWMVTENEAKTSPTASPFAVFIEATGGTVTTSGNFKIHTFTGDGCFVVSQSGNPAGSNTVDYMVVAGGGGGGNANANNNGSSGGGAGGFRMSNSTCMPGPQTSPLASPTGLPVSAQTYPIAVGGGGAGNPACSPGSAGSNSSFSTITSAGGGQGSGNQDSPTAPGIGGNGGSGGGGHQGPGTSPGCRAGVGNTPPVSPPQGNPGGGASAPSGNGGGGAGASGGNTQPGPNNAGTGAIGTFVVSCGFAGCNGEGCGPVSGTRYFAGGGGGANSQGRSPPGNPGDAAVGGGGVQNTAGDANTGGGGGGGAIGGSSGAGGKGIVIIRYKFQ